MGDRGTLQRAYRKHLEEKTGLLRERLRILTRGSLAVEIVPTPLEEGFRSRAKFKLFAREGSAEARATDPRSGEVPAAEALWMLPERGRGIADHILRLLSRPAGGLRVDGVELRLVHGKGEAHVTLSVSREETRSVDEVCTGLLENVRGLVGVAVPSRRKAFGRLFLEHRILGRTYLSHHGAFFQANIPLTPLLVRAVKLAVDGREPGRLVDLYCGCGLLSLASASRSAEVVGVDSHSRAVRSARLNAERLGFHQAAFIEEKAERFLLSAGIRPEDCVILDPPRAGVSGEVIRSLAAARPHRVVSLSCSLPTHARDLGLWLEEGYRIRAFLAFDMFPFTPYLETLALLERRPAG